MGSRRQSFIENRGKVSQRGEINRLVQICANAGKTQHCRQPLGETLETMVATRLDA
ncbi:hypothetical protein D9M72_638810 [compost metagenome]